MMVNGIFVLLPYDDIFLTVGNLPRDEKRDGKAGSCIYILYLRDAEVRGVVYAGALSGSISW
jgi:hypothetical protein